MSMVFRKSILSGWVIFFFNTFQALAAIDVATISSLKGQGEVFTNPQDRAKKSDDDGPLVLFEKKYYVVKPAKLGLKVKGNEVVRTASDGKMRLIFTNGDMITVGPATAYSLSERKSSDTSGGHRSIIHLIYGKLRSVISKAGPRKNLQIETPIALAGVRGTDFSISYLPSQAQSNITVVRGQVEMNDIKSKRSVVVEKGYTASLTAFDEGKPQVTRSGLPIKMPPALKINKATKQDLTAMLTEFQVPSRAENDNPLAVLSDSTEKEITALEATAVQAIVEDIKAYRHEESSTDVLNKESLDYKSLDELNAASVAEVYQHAPSVSDRQKPSEDHLKKQLNQDIYERYFKPVK